MAGTEVARRGSGGVLASLTPVDIEAYPALTEGVEGMIEVLSDNVGGQLELADLVRVSVPTGGDTDWKIPSKLGKDERTETIRGIVVHWSDSRVWWPGTELSHKPPECWSTDGKRPDPNGAFGDYGSSADRNLPVTPVGGGTPVRMCAPCPMNEWGSSPKEGARGKACKQQKLLFILREDEELPMLLAVPPTSLRPVRAAMLELTTKTKSHYSGFLLDFTLVKRSNGSNDYGEIKIALAGALPGVRSTREGGPEADSPAALAKAYSDAFGKLLTPEVLAAAAAAGDRPADDGSDAPDGLGGDFAEHDLAT